MQNYAPAVYEADTWLIVHLNGDRLGQIVIETEIDFLARGMCNENSKINDSQTFYGLVFCPSLT